MNNLLIQDLDDYISPSQACINPIFETSSNDLGGVKLSNTIDLEYEDDQTNFLEPNLIKSTSTKKAVVSLSDCLACR